jgi:hypothetical protein
MYFNTYKKNKQFNSITKMQIILLGFIVSIQNIISLQSPKTDYNTRFFDTILAIVQCLILVQ